MNKSNNKKINFYKNAIITYDNGEKEMFDAISITDNGIYIGTIRTNKDHCEEFIDDGLISIENIKKLLSYIKTVNHKILYLKGDIKQVLLNYSLSHFSYFIS
jgi:hypothetical protein